MFNSFWASVGRGQAVYYVFIFFLIYCVEEKEDITQFTLKLPV